MIVAVKHIQAYGKNRYYPENDTAKALLEFSGGKCFTRKQLQILKSIDIGIEICENDYKHEDINI